MDIEMGDIHFSKTIEQLLEEGNAAQALALLKDEKNCEEICNNSWDLVPIVARYLTEEYENKNVELFKCCQKLIDIIAEKSKAEEVLLQFIEEIETAKDDTKFLSLLKPLEKILLRVPDKRVTSLAWCFNAIKSYLVKVESPIDFNLTDEERLLLDGNWLVQRIIDLYEELLMFCETFLQELTTTKCGNIAERKAVIGKFLVELVGKPLAFLDMEMYKNTKPKARIIAEKLIIKATSIIRDPYVFLEMQGTDDGCDLIKPSDLSLGAFYYLILSEQICLQTIPKVYNPVHVLHNSLKFIIELVSPECQFAIEKGVHLAKTLLQSINKLQLPYLLLDSEHHSKFSKMVSNVIVHNESEKLRKSALAVLHSYLWAFEHQGRYLIVLNLMRCISHSGLKGNLVTQYKEMLTQELRNNDFKNVSKYYRGRKLFDLLNHFTYLKQKEETDMVDESDQIVSTLNFLRFLVMADKTGCTDIDTYFHILEDGYLKHLKIGVDMSREHYRLKIKEIHEESATDRKKSDFEVSVKVSGKNLAEIPSERKIEIMNLSLTTLDVIDSLLSRLTECIRIRKTTI